MRKTHIAKFLGAAMALTMAFTGCASNESHTASDSAADGSAARAQEDRHYPVRFSPLP